MPPNIVVRMVSLGLTRHQTKGVFWRGSTRIDHLGFVWAFITLKFTVNTTKQAKVREHPRSLLKEAQKGRGLVSTDLLRSFTGVTTSLHLALPLALFYTLSLYDVLADFSEVSKPAARGGARVRLSGGMTARAKTSWRCGSLGMEAACLSKRSRSGPYTPMWRNWDGTHRPTRQRPWEGGYQPRPWCPDR